MALSLSFVENSLAGGYPASWLRGARTFLVRLKTHAFARPPAWAWWHRREKLSRGGGMVCLLRERVLLKSTSVNATDAPYRVVKLLREAKPRAFE